MGELGDENAAFEIPGDGFGGGGVDVAADEGADAVDFSVETGGVVWVAREAEVRVVEVLGFVCFIVFVEGSVDGAANGGLGFGVRGGDLDFLECEDVRPFPAAEAGSEGGLVWGWL